MAKGKIRGITVEIGGDTTKLGKALDAVNQKSRELQSELNGVNSLLKLDPSNMDLLRQKQDLLTQSINETKEKLSILKETQSQVQEQFERGDITAEQYRDFQREIVATEQKLEKLTDQMHEFGSASATVIANAGNSIKDFGGKVTDIGKNMTQNVTLPIAAGAVALAEGTKELRGDLARLEVNAEATGRSMADMEQHMTQIVGVTGEVDSSIEGLSNLLATGISDEGFNAIMDSMSGAAIKFSDTLKFEGIADGLQETLATGEAVGAFAELLERSGIVLDDFNVGLEKAIKNGTEENYILDTLAKTGLAEYYQAYRDGNPDLVAATEAEYQLQVQLAELGALIAPIVAKFTAFAATVLEAFNSMSPEAKNFTLLLVGIVAALGPLVVVIGTIISSVGTILTLAPTLATAITAVKTAFGLLNVTMAANPIGAVIIAITGLIAILVSAYNNCEWFRNGVDGFIADVVGFFKSIPSELADLPSEMLDVGLEMAQGVVDGILEGASGIVNAMVSSVKNAIQKAKDALKIKSPSRVARDEIGKETIRGVAVGINEGANEPSDAMGDAVTSVIKRGVNITRDISSTFTGANNGVPVGDIVSLLSNYLPQIADASSRQIVLDGDAIVGGTIDRIDARLGQSALLKARGV